MIQNDSKCVTAAPLKFMLMLLRRSAFMHVSSGPHTYNKQNTQTWTCPLSMVA